MPKYNIRTKSTTHLISESVGNVVDAPEAVDWMIGLPFSYVRHYCQRKGWSVEPVIDPQHPFSLEYKGVLYIFDWEGNKLVNMTAVKDGTSEDISWKELPEILKGLL